MSFVCNYFMLPGRWSWAQPLFVWVPTFCFVWAQSGRAGGNGYVTKSSSVGWRQSRLWCGGRGVVIKKKQSFPLFLMAGLFSSLQQLPYSVLFRVGLPLFQNSVACETSRPKFINYQPRGLAIKIWFLYCNNRNLIIFLKNIKKGGKYANDHT